MRTTLHYLAVLMVLVTTGCDAPQDELSAETTLRAGSASTQSAPEDLGGGDEEEVVPEPSPSPSPSSYPSPEPEPSPSPSPSPTPTPSPSPTPSANAAPVWHTQPEKYLELDRELQIDLGLGHDSDLDSYTYVFERQYWCTIAKQWNQLWAVSVNNNVLRVVIPATKDDYLPHFYLVSVTDAHGAKSYRMIEVGWGGGSSWAPLYTTDSGASFSSTNLCGGATVYSN